MTRLGQIAILVLSTLAVLAGDPPQAPSSPRRQVESPLEPSPDGESSKRLGAAGAAPQRPTPEVRRAIRLLLSSNPEKRKRGRHQLILLGEAVAPQLRYWIRTVRDSSARVESVLALLEGDRRQSVGFALEIDDFFRDKLRQASELKEQGEYRHARKLAEALLTLEPNQPGAWEVRRFVRECAERIAARELLEPAFSAVGRVHEVGDAPELVFRIMNRSDQTAVIHLENGVLGRAKVSITQEFLGGGTKRAEQQLIVRAAAPDERIIIGPGRKWEQPVQLNLNLVPPLAGMVSRVQMVGRFRPTRWTADDRNDNLSLSLPAMELWFVPPGQVALSDRPLEKLTAALVFDQEEAFFVGGQLAVWAGEQDPIYNGKVVDTLIAHIDQLEGLRLASGLSFLEQATGMGFGAELEKWKDWWSSLRRGSDSEAAP